MTNTARLSTWPDHLGLGVGCSITAVAIVYAVVAMALPGGIGELTTIVSGSLVILGGIAAGWVLSATYFAREPVASGMRALHFPVSYQFEPLFSWRWSPLSKLDALSYALETLGQIGWLVVMPIDRFGRMATRRARR